MRTAFAVSAALLLAGTAYVHPAHAQMTTQPHTAAPQAQTQQFGDDGPKTGPAQWRRRRPGLTAPLVARAHRARRSRIPTAAATM